MQPINEQKNLVQERIEIDNKLATSLKEAGYIAQYEVYQDKNAYELRSSNTIRPDLQAYYEILLMQMKGPILRDSIEDNDHGVINKVPRQEIRDALFIQTSTDENGVAHRPLYDFYESNKLQQSNVANMLSVLDAIKNEAPISDDLKKSIEVLVDEFSNPKEGEERSPVNQYGFSHPRYKYVLDNQGRYEFVKRLEEITEKVLLEITKLPVS